MQFQAFYFLPFSHPAKMLWLFLILPTAPAIAAYWFRTRRTAGWWPMFAVFALLIAHVAYSARVGSEVLAAQGTRCCSSSLRLPKPQKLISVAHFQDDEDAGCPCGWDANPDPSSPIEAFAPPLPAYQRRPDDSLLPFFLFGLVAAIVVAAAAAATASDAPGATIDEEQTEKIIEQARTADEMTRQLEFDAKQADLLIRAYSEEAFRQGQKI